MSDSVLRAYRRRFAEAVAQATGLAASDVEAQVRAAEPAHGDLAFAAFALAKRERKAPPAIAADLATRLAVPGMQIAAAGPYVNARFDASRFAADVIGAVRAEGERYGCSAAGAGKTVVMDFSSPNIAKPIAFHHIRSTVIGNLYRSQGWKVVGINYLGDWGKQFGLVAAGLEDAGASVRRDDVAQLVDVYVKASARAEKEPAFDERARALFRKMEEGDPALLALWQELRTASLRDFERVYARLGIHFDSYEGESRYQGKMDAVIDEITRTVGTRTSQGALVVDMPYADGEPPVLLRKDDGSTLYATRDIAAAMDRHARFAFDRSLYVVATDQALHFRQVFAVLARMGKPWADRMTHVGFGRVHGMSTRRGQMVLLENVLDEARARALDKVTESQKAGRLETGDPVALAEQVGIGAIVFGDLKNKRLSDYTFDWDQVLDFEGHTGPYLQYAHARACNVLKRGGGEPGTADHARLGLPEEHAVVRALAELPLAVEQATADNEPSVVSRQLIELAAAFSRFYTLGNQEREKRILVEGDDALRAARLALTDAVRIALAVGLTLLGVPTPESM